MNREAIRRVDVLDTSTNSEDLFRVPRSFGEPALHYQARSPETPGVPKRLRSIERLCDCGVARDVAVDAPWLATVEEMGKRGRELVRKAWGERADQELAGTVTHEFLPGAAAIVDGYHYGEVWARSPLTDKERMVSILAALMSRGHWSLLRRQIGYALNVGLTKREICETFSQAGWYRGWPYVEDALTEAKKVFAERGI